MGADVYEFDFPPGAVQMQNNTVFLSDANSMEVLQFAMERVQTEVRLERVRLQIA
jgi:hypothetical protein